MNGTPLPNQHLVDAVIRLRGFLSRAIVGGDDPSESDEALRDIESLEALYEGPEAKRVASFVEVMRSPAALPGVSRQVVLARGQRFLFSLAVALEEAAEQPPARAPREARRPVETPCDPELLALPGIGPKTAARLASRGIASPYDLLFLLPRRYDDRREVTPIAALEPGRRQLTRGAVSGVRCFGPPWRQSLEIVLEDGEDTVSLIYFSKKRPRRDAFEKGAIIRAAGLVGEYKGRRQIPHPVIAREAEASGAMERVVPIYPEVPGVAGRIVEKAVRAAAARAETIVRDPVPEALLARRELLPLAEALRMVHVPPADIPSEDLRAWVEGSSPAHRRLIYDEFFFIQLALALRRGRNDARTAPVMAPVPAHRDELEKLVGFAPTAAQRRVIGEIARDLTAPRPMQRLLQGDVGSGKTFVALAAILQAVRSGHQAALMAPTEILAEQHMRTLHPVLRKLGIRAVLHLGGARSSARKKTLAALEKGVAHVAVGTHALLQESVRFFRLGLAVVDEQHRFGVSQRLGLVGKGPEGATPHLLVMTATPIPRTLALTVHGDLDVSVLDELPPGRTPVRTEVWSGERRGEVFSQVAAALERGEQGYVVCPIIEESEVLDVRAAEAVFEELTARFRGRRVALLHGRLKDEDKEGVMAGFAAGEIDLLVTTTVVEVGVDVPNATVMVVEGAERFGLAQLHQLRGRVGRSNLASACHLVSDPKSEDAMERLAVLARTNDGFEVAEADLAIRGPGELYGRRQAGLPGFRYGHLQRDAEMLTLAREDVRSLLAADPALRGPDVARLREELARRVLADEAPVGEEAG